jgi:CRISPR/Cas system CMR-associated protein Cmr1 (group 7 of RAMP superfamily)
MSRNQELEKLKLKINQLLKTDKELNKIGMCGITHDSPRNYLQFMPTGIADISKKYGLKISVAKRGSFPWDISIPELKIFAIAANSEMNSLGIPMPE